MDAPIDSVDKTPYPVPGKVNPLHHSEREKQREFSKALQEQMEEELEKSRKERAEDELLLRQEEREHGQQNTQEPPDSKNCPCEETVNDETDGEHRPGQ